ncbi:hypothetical protein BGX26_011711 [Mortierella sp. AD094]|nr:hypothetical protein BGX26_011711 [Mortierella sp. AD094]
MSLVNGIKEQFRKRLSRRRHQSSTPVASASTNAPLVSAGVATNAGVFAGAGIGSVTKDLTISHILDPSPGIITSAADTTALNSSSAPVLTPTPTVTMTTAIRRRGRPPSPYPSSVSSSQARARSQSADFHTHLPFRRTMGSTGVSLRSHLEDVSHSPQPQPLPAVQPSAPQRPVRRRPRWLQQAVAKVVRFKQASQSAVSNKARSAVNILTRRKSSKGKQEGDRQQTSPYSSNITDSLDDSDIEDLDLRYFYDPRSEDPVNRMVFIAGPEHFYHLALQLETSPRQEFQLYAKELFIRSAGLGFAPAQFKLGICYELGLTHFPTDPAQSFAWYKRAALQGHADAELAVSGWYLTGHPQGLIQSEPLAYEWASKAARRGWSKAEYTLGHYHEVGIGVPQDLGVAKQWYLKAAAKGNERAFLRLLVGHVGLDVDYAQLKDALLDQNQNNPYLIHQLAQFHELREYGLVPDEDAAFELYAASAQANYAPAQYKLGACYEFGILSCPKDPVQAVHWYSQGAENGHVEALLALAGYYLDGSAGLAAEQSDEEAFRYVKAAAQRGVPKAEYITGFFLEYGLGVERNTKEAKQWYRLACAKGVDSAERRLRELEKGAVPVATTA